MPSGQIVFKGRFVFRTLPRKFVLSQWLNYGLEPITTDDLTLDVPVSRTTTYKIMMCATYDWNWALSWVEQVADADMPQYHRRYFSLTEVGVIQIHEFLEQWPDRSLDR